ncbi:hypothetical protein [Pseudomonas sp.]|uniref:hypothetical protein n=1 Tax=Pseudomonas sp. TaxID=306 RepID=UPI00248A13B7|nr:hypothetical protein [Pseudomonas sp.]MDI1331739.1 hypothetical protein [Pseudomonas sp.]
MAIVLIKNNIAIRLPKALEGDEGFVSRDILYDITHVVRQGSKKIRNLISKISGENPSPKEDVIQRLCELIVDTQFLEKWESENRSSACPHFTALVSMYVLQKEKAFDLESEELKGCFEKRKIDKENKFFPVLHELGKLVNVIKESNSETWVKALFAWLLQSWVNEALNDNCNEPSLLGFETGLKTALSEAGLSSIVELIAAPVWKGAGVAIVGAGDEVKAQNIGGRKEFQVEQQSPVNFLEREVSGQIRELDGAVQKYKAGLQVIGNKSKLLSKEGDQVAILTAIIDAAENSRATLHKIEQDASKIVARIDAEINEFANRLGLKLTLPNDDRFSIFSLVDWSGYILKRTKVSQKCRDEFSYLLKSGVGKEELAALSGPASIVGYNELLGHLVHLKFVSDRCAQGRRSIEKLCGAISENCTNLRWNPFHDPEFTAEIWLAIARYRMLDKTSDQLLGIIVCRYFEFLH